MHDWIEGGGFDSFKKVVVGGRRYRLIQVECYRASQRRSLRVLKILNLVKRGIQ